MVQFHKFICATVCGALAIGTAHAAELPDPRSSSYRELPLMLDETGTIYSKLTISRTKQTGDQQTSHSFETHARYDFEWDDEAEAFRVVKSTLPLKSSNTSLSQAPVDLSDMTTVFKTLAQISYQADESLSPVEIRNWPELKEDLKRIFRSVSLPEGTTNDFMFNQLYGGMDAQTAAPYLLEAELFAAIPHNLGLEIGKPLIDDTPLMVPMGNFPLDAQVRLTLTSWDEASNTAKVHYLFAPKPEALDHFIRVHLPATLKAANAPPDVLKMIEDAVKAKGAGDLFESKTECHYDMAIDTGLIRKGECTKHTRINLLDSMTAQTDKWTFSESFNP
ncbi:hypothetical protein [Asticcacaulis tiandongensis]|uniref:hypothetical protein n=1 Tax=Asticcacaulis tiandongensis TaxID=2565365 RepID=UPI001127227C|nr:hypothetical protein [Asticcacaulis tiandongensis]